MEEKKILTKKEAMKIAKERGLSDEELDKVTGGVGQLNWAWNSVYAIKSWPDKYDVQYIFTEGSKLKIWEFFGGGEEGTVVRTIAEYDAGQGGWIDKYLVDTNDDVLHWCKRDVIVYQG